MCDQLSCIICDHSSRIAPSAKVTAEFTKIRIYSLDSASDHLFVPLTDDNKKSERPIDGLAKRA